MNTCVYFQPNKPAAFKVNLNNAKGQLKTFVDTPSGTEEDVFVQVLKIRLGRSTRLKKGIHFIYNCKVLFK